MNKQFFKIIGGIFISILLVCIIANLPATKNNVEGTFGFLAFEKNLLSPVDLTDPQTTKAPGKSKKKDQKTEQTAETTSAPKPEDAIYSYLQGPKSWGRRLPWSGKWGVTTYDGSRFGAFGCGLCCIANIYSSITPYQCTPVDAYHFAKKHTYYHGGGAIDWKYLKQTFSLLGFSTELQEKPDSYKEFQNIVAAGKMTLTLISSSNSTCYWKNTPGHYVTVSLYRPETDMVFLTDSGDPDHNRHWIELKKVYKSLKTASSWQILNVLSYQEEKDIWKHTTADGKWVRGNIWKGE